MSVTLLNHKTAQIGVLVEWCEKEGEGNRVSIALRPTYSGSLDPFRQ
jgi:hypothetical protein